MFVGGSFVHQIWADNSHADLLAYFRDYHEAKNWAQLHADVKTDYPLKFVATDSRTGEMHVVSVAAQDCPK